MVLPVWTHHRIDRPGIRMRGDIGLWICQLQIMGLLSPYHISYYSIISYSNARGALWIIPVKKYRFI